VTFSPWRFIFRIFYREGAKDAKLREVKSTLVFFFAQLCVLSAVAVAHLKIGQRTAKRRDFGWFLGALTMTRFLMAPGPSLSASAREIGSVKMGRAALESGAGEQWIRREFMGNSKSE
jgi:hypothetical protein